MSEWTRRDFLKFMGRSAVVAGSAPWLVNCASKPKLTASLPFPPISPTTEDAVKLADGFRYDLLLRWRQSINKTERFGFNNDYLAYLPLNASNPHEGLLWVNHEYPDPYYTSGWKPGMARTTEQIHIERKEVGGSIVHVQKIENQWRMIENSKYNRRLDGFTKIPLISEQPIVGHRTAIGTFANCAGGVTPWGTVLTCEENYDNFVGEVVFKDDKRTVETKDGYMSWTKSVKLPPEHYGWVVEVDLKTAKAKKLCGLGRFAHECATTILAPDGRTVVYSGDDADNEHIYKFISAKAGSLEQGDLFVADMDQGRWLPLSRAKDERLRKAFRNHTELLIRTREAAKIVGATPMDRPEDIEIDPRNNDVFVALTGNKSKGNLFGSLLKISEKDNNPLSLEFTSSTFMAGGPETGFACPDNLTFDRKGNLWMCNDMSGSSMLKAPFDKFGNNGLFYIPLSGPHAGQALQVASAPRGAEFTGPYFSPDGKTLFLSVQHPGERAQTRPHMVSHWPDGGDSIPAPCVIVLSGPALEALTV